jgi:SAM-dependent methyltransferase
MKQLIAEISDASPFLASLKYLKGQLLYRAGLRGHGSGATAARGGIEKTARYLEGVVRDYLEYGKLDNADLSNKHILEIGPGDTLGVAMLLFAKGAASVTCVDRFKPKVDVEKNRLICESLFRNLGGEEKLRVEGLLDCIVRNESSPDGRLVARYGLPIEQLRESSGHGGYDLIISRAVLEHVYNLHDAWMGMIGVLNPNGQMVHKIDFRNHGYYFKVHPLYFLTLEEMAWNMVSSPDPTLNRNRKGTYESLLSRTCKDYTLHYTSILENPEVLPHPTKLILGEHYSEKDLSDVQSIRPRLAKAFRGISDMDLLVSGVFIRCRKL